ncbi:MAG: virulence-associated E family protein, partial [bacterium]
HLNTLRWDGTPRLDTWLTKYARAADTEYTRAVGRIVLVAAVRRARCPGCKFDEMMILESAQGTNKSTALSVLAGDPDWFTDDLPLGNDTKQAMEQTSGKWIVEAGELRGMSRGDVHALKGYLSRRFDEARMAYGRKRKKMMRQFVIIGTTNETTDYLKDGTGNRRFWPVRINEFNLEALRSDRDQLWAEAAHCEATGSSIRLDPSLYAAAGEVQEERRAEDAMEVLIGQAFGELTGKIRTSEAWRILGIEGRVLTQDEMTRFGAAMRRLGWQRAQKRDGGDLAWHYVKGDIQERLRRLRVERESGSIAVVEPAPAGEG